MASLGKDLAYLRKQQNLTIDDIYDRTRIPIETIQSIEDDSIFTDFKENFTYIRSFVRSYGRALKLDEEVMIKALDQTETGNYDDLLLRTYAPGDSDKTRKFQLDVDDETQKSGDEPEEQPSGEEPETDQSAPKKSSVQRPKGAYDQHDPSRPETEDVPRAPDMESVNWAALGRRFKQFESRSPIWILFIFLIVIVAVAVSYFFYSGSNLGETLNTAGQRQDQELTMPDSLQMQLQTPTETQEDTVEAAPDQTTMDELPDTLYLVVYAARDKLEPVRVRSDVIDTFMPYWIEQGDAMRFEFTRNINVQGQYGRMVLMFNGHPIPDFRDEFFRADSGYIDIDRSFFENEPKWRSAPPDSLPLDVPAPNRIIDRPIFP